MLDSKFAKSKKGSVADAMGMCPVPRPLLWSQGFIYCVSLANH